MSTAVENNASFHVDLPSGLKAIVEQAATHLGQTVGEFAAATLVRTAYDVIQQHERTVLSSRDRDVFLALLEDADAEPNDDLRAAADHYKQHMS